MFLSPRVLGNPSNLSLDYRWIIDGEEFISETLEYNFGEAGSYPVSLEINSTFGTTRVETIVTVEQLKFSSLLKEKYAPEK